MALAELQDFRPYAQTSVSPGGFVPASAALHVR